MCFEPTEFLYSLFTTVNKGILKFFTKTDLPRLLLLTY